MKTVLITGASGGIGKEFVQLFAEKRYHLILVARSEDKLQQIANEYKKKYKIKITVLALDLSQANAATKLYTALENKKINVDILINNAGFGEFENFIDAKLSRITEMINLNITTLTALTLLVLKDMKHRNEGKILNVASTAAFQPIPKFAIYAATKSYVLSFTEALHFELKKTNISVSALCPGATLTGFQEAAKMENSKLFKNGVMHAKTVAKIGYNGLMKGKMTIIPGFKNKVLALLSNITPSRNLLVWVASKAV